MPRLSMKLAGMTVGAVLLLWTSQPASAQNQKTAKPYSPHRLADGHPDLQGTYDLATLTPVDRPLNALAVYTKEEARKREAAAAQRRAEGDKSLSADDAPLRSNPSGIASEKSTIRSATPSRPVPRKPTESKGTHPERMTNARTTSRPSTQAHLQ
jgi:hypothetical protein